MDVIRWLLAKGMSPNVLNNADSTPMHSAAGAGQGFTLVHYSAQRKHLFED